MRWKALFTFLLYTNLLSGAFLPVVSTCYSYLNRSIALQILRDFDAGNLRDKRKIISGVHIFGYRSEDFNENSLSVRRWSFICDHGLITSYSGVIVLWYFLSTCKKAADQIARLTSSFLSLEYLTCRERIRKHWLSWWGILHQKLFTGGFRLRNKHFRSMKSFSRESEREDTEYLRILISPEGRTNLLWPFNLHYRTSDGSLYARLRIERNPAGL